METQVREAGPFERLVTLHLGEADLERAKDRAARKLSRELKIKGFRPGKAPRRIVEATVGPDTLRREAIEEALPGALGSFLRQAELFPATAPQVEELRDIDDGVEVDVKVTLWPRLEAPPDYRDRRVTLSVGEVTEQEVDRQVDRLREQYAELETVSRLAQEGDYVSIDLAASHHGDPVEEASAHDFLYELGSNSFIPRLDEELVGHGRGEITRFNTVLPQAFGDAGGREVTLQVLVKDVKRKKLPDLSDEWVSEVSEFEAVEELRERLRENLAELKRSALRSEFRAKVLEELLHEVDLRLPETLVGMEMERVLQRFVRELEARDIPLEQFLEATGQSQEAFLDGLREEAERNLKTNALLEAVVESEGLEVTGEELDEVTAALAKGAGRDVGEYRRALRKGNQEQALASDILRQKAFEVVVEAAVPIDVQGNPIDLRAVTEAAETEEGGPDEEPARPAEVSEQ
ncbi:MAG: trigger factor [Actinomycetota bacterium]|nr:trigger factor [Actinomycetota bacterium]